MPFIAYDPRSARHDWPGHPETAARAAAILKAFEEDPVVRAWDRLAADRLLERDEALTVHTPRLWLNLELADTNPPTHVDPDTYVVGGSFEAARATARLGIQAVERCLREDDAGFAVARPPGHHATKDRSMGFCLFNNVALAAQHATEAGVRRVLVFDHDVHHGNGTQDIFSERDDVLYQSFHLAPHYPGSGAVDELGAGKGRGFTVNAPLERGDGDPQVRSLLHHVFLPIARAYKPDLVLVSAGFDSLSGDPLGGLTLTPPMFGEIVGLLRDVQPRLVVFLEGGYQLDRIPVAAVTEAHAMVGRGHSGSAGPQQDPASLRRLSRTIGDHWTL